MFLDVSFEHGDGAIQSVIAVPASDLHPCGFNVTPGLVPAFEFHAAAATGPLLFLFVVHNRAALTGGWSNEIIPPGVCRVCLSVRALEMSPGQGRMFRNGH